MHDSVLRRPILLLTLALLLSAPAAEAGQSFRGASAGLVENRRFAPPLDSVT